MHILEISKSSSAKTEFSFFSVFFRRFSVFSVFSIPTSVSVSVFKNIAISVSVFGYRLGSNTYMNIISVNGRSPEKHRVQLAGDLQLMKPKQM